MIPTLLHSRQIFLKKYFSLLQHPLKAAVQRLLLISDYAIRNVNHLQELLAADDCLSPLPLSFYFEQAKKIEHQSSAHFSKAIRKFRHYYFLRLLIRELAGLADTEETLQTWSACADALILRSLEFCEQELCERFGKPYETSGKPAQIYVLAMGKLGGQELNYSSDIDLIFAYSGVGETDGKESISNQEYYTKVIQLFVQLLQNPTEDGFVYRVDLRLRPYGESGALVVSLAFLEAYYQEQGRDWERYAMVKARLITTESLSPEHWFHRLITPFVYRRYIDFSVIESLRAMKGMIESEVQLNPSLDDIKRGSGGIREIEFIIQNAQLIRGGRNPLLRCQNALAALDILRKEKLLPHTHVLKKAYLFLRKIENYLQCENDEQTHSLPVDPIKQAQISYAMNASSWLALIEQLQRYQRIVTALFHLTLGKVDDPEDQERLLIHQLNSLWQGQIEPQSAINLLTSIGYTHSSQCYQMIHTFRHSPKCRRLNQAVRLRLDRFMVLVLKELIPIKHPHDILLQLIRLVENIVGRSAYLALLTENQQALRELLHCFSQSQFITRLIVNHPFLLELLLRDNKDWKPPLRRILAEQLAFQLSDCVDDEHKEEALRRFKLTQWLLAAYGELNKGVCSVRVGQFLADVAEVILHQVVHLAYEQLLVRYPLLHAHRSQFAIIAYGKLGTREMNYDSDLDLVFIHTTLNQESFIIRLTQKIMHMLTTSLQSGILYRVDTRLRPSGEAGLLVSRLNAFIDYQEHHAWTWEHQALIRSRLLIGSSSIASRFRQLKKTVFSMKREASALSKDVWGMLEKILQQHAQEKNIKYMKGGLVTLEFLVQFLFLSNPDLHYVNAASTLTLIKKLAKAKKISSADEYQLIKAYHRYHSLLHLNLLQPEQSFEASTEQENINEISKFYFSLSPHSLL